MAATKKRIAEILQFYQENGHDKTIETFDLKAESLERYKRLGLKEYDFKDIEKNAILRKIRDQYTEKELTAIANGGRIIPGMSKAPVIDFEGQRIRVGIISDTHIGSIYTDDDYIYKAFEEFRKESVEFVCHCGDVTEGMSNRQGHVYECSHIGYNNQKKHAIEVLGQTEWPTYAIDGNHDRWFIKSNGAKIVQDIAEMIPQMDFIGHDEGDISLKGKGVLKLWHGEDGNCFDDKTEILTRDGFIPFHELTKKHQVATMSKDKHVFEWQKPTDITRQKYKGKLIHFKARCVDLAVTPNHGMWIKATESILKRKVKLLYPTKSHRRLNNQWHRQLAKDVLSTFRKQKYQLPATVNDFVSSKIDFVEIPKRKSKNSGVKVHHFGLQKTKDIAELIAWYVTEGWIGKKGAIVICQDKKVNPENHKQILDLLKRIGVTNVRMSGKNEKDIVFGSMEMADFLKKECGSLSRHKYLPDWLKEQNKDILSVVFDTMVKGDGWTNHTSCCYKSYSKKLREDFGLIALKLGYGISYSNDTVCVRFKQINPQIVSKPKEIDYSGKIYCCSVPNGLIYVRRNGRCIWTHNSYAKSYRVQKIAESLTGGEKPNVMFAGHCHKALYDIERNIHIISAGSIQKQSKYLRGKRIGVETGFWICDIWVNNSGVSKFTSTWYPFY